MKKIFYGVVLVFVAVLMSGCGGDGEIGDVPMAASGSYGYYDYHSLNSVDASGGATVWATVTDERFTIHTVFISGPAALNVQLLDGADEITTYYFGTNSSQWIGLDIKSAAVGNDLTVKASGSGQISVVVSGNSIWH